MKKSLILLIIILTGLILRCYNLNSPSIGYHNMKENEALNIAQEMLRSGDYIGKRLYFENPFAAEPLVVNNPQPALAAYQVLFSWKIFGENLWGARLVNIFFGLGAIAVIYFIALILFGARMPALSAAAVAAILPLGIFFSRNIQAESPALFFMLLGSLFYLRSVKSPRKRYLIAGGLSFCVSWAYAFNFIIGVIPLLFCLPYKLFAKNKKKFPGILASLALPYLVLVLIIVSLIKNGQWAQFWGQGARWDIFLPDYWLDHGKVVSWYASGENFTPVFSILALLGMILAFMKGNGLLNRYIIGSTIALLVYGVFFSTQLYQQNFSQMPFLPMVAVAGVYALLILSQGLRIFKKELFIYFFIAAVAISGFFIHASLKRMHGMVFIGLDAAGESLKDLTLPDERIFLRTHSQGYGILRYARRYGGWIDDPQEFKNAEQRFGIRYICFYPSELAKSLEKENPALFGYIKDNYHAKEIGFLEEPNRLFYIILERGKGAPGEAFLESFAGPKQLKTIYRLEDRLAFLYVIRPQPGASQQAPGPAAEAKKNEDKPK